MSIQFCKILKYFYCYVILILALNFWWSIIMKNTSLCYIEKDGAYLMMHRTKKENDENHDKWVGIGGKFESGESPYDCVIREIKEESGLNANSVNYRGIITFVSDIDGTEYMHLFTCNDFSGNIIDECDEGHLEWVPKNKINSLPIWEGDKVFFDLLDTQKDFFSLKLIYQGNKLISYKIN